MNLAERLGYDYCGFEWSPGGAQLGTPGYEGSAASNYPKAWLDRWTKQNYIDHDPVYAFSLAGEGVRTWTALPQDTPEAKTMMADAAHHGLEAGLVAAYPEMEGGRFTLILGGVEPVGDPEIASDALPILLPLIAAQYRRAHRAEVVLARLTARERTVLLELEKGNRRVDIAGTLNIHERSVDRHLQAIKKKFGARTLHELVLNLK